MSTVEDDMMQLICLKVISVCVCVCGCGDSGDSGGV